MWRALEGHDGLAWGFSRLLVIIDPARLPEAGEDAWRYYLRCWRLGKPHAKSWLPRWDAALAATQ